MAKPESIGFQMAMDHKRMTEQRAAQRAADPNIQIAQAAFEKRCNEAIDASELPDRIAVEGATVVCTMMSEPESESKMKKTDTSNAELLQGGYMLVHTDIEFEPKFEKCRYNDEECEPEIDDEEWHEHYEKRMSNGGYGILKEKSFMICMKGFGLLYLSEDGQQPCDMKALLAMLMIKFGDRALLGRLMCAAFGGDPVNMATGNFIFARTDLEIGGGIPIKFQRFYNTFDEQVGSLGKGWRHPYDIKLIESKEGITITFEDGHDEVYQLGDGKGDEAKNEKPQPKETAEPKSEPPKGYFFEMMKKEKEERQKKQKKQKNEPQKEKPKGYRLSKPGETLPNPDDKHYDAPEGNFNGLVRCRDNYRLAKPDGVTLHFDKAGNLVKINDQDQVETILTYEDDKLVRLVGVSGSLAFTYEDDKISTITDHTGRTTCYTYDGDLLTSATDPLGNVRTYAYDEKGRFLNEINPEGNLTVENEYDDKNRVIKQHFADGAKMCYNYEDREVQNIKETLKTEFIAQNGVKTNYYRDVRYRTLEVEYPDHGIIQTEYNWKDQKISETDKIGPRTYYEYDDKGNLSRIENPLGEMTDLTYDDKNQLTKISVEGIVKLENEYDSNGNLVAAADALKRQVRFTYDRNNKGLPTHIAQPDGSVIKVKYDDRRNVTQVTNPHGVTTSYEYDSLNRVIKTVDGNGNSTQFNYDENNNLTRVTSAEGNGRTYTYNKDGKVEKIVFENEAEMQFAYNKLGKPEAVIDPLGRITSFTYDKMWNVSQVTQPNGAETSFIYDKNNRLVTIEKPDETTIHFKYNKNDQKTQITDEAGNNIYLTYDKLKRLIEVRNDEDVKLAYTYNTDGQITSITDAMDNMVLFMYNKAGELIKETNALGDSRTYTYTALGKIAAMTDESGRTTNYEYEPGGRLKSIIHPNGTSEILTYDNNGNIKNHISGIGNKTTYEYDSLNRVTEIIHPNSGSRKYTYDAASNLTSVTNELDHVTNYVYTLTGKLEKVIDALGNETHYTYDKLNQLIDVKQLGEIDGIDMELTQINQLNEANRTTSYKRNILGQVTSVTDALGQSEYYKYSPTGQLIEKLDKDGFTTEYGYTSQNNVNYIKYENEKEVHLSYNTLGQLTKVKDWFGTTTVELDKLGRPLSVTNHRNEQVQYSYGKAGERQCLIYPDGKIVNYHYDDALRLTQIQDGKHFTNYIYDQYSRLVEKQYSNGTYTKYQYNELSQLRSLTHSQYGKDWRGKNMIENLDQLHYEYDMMGNKTEINRIRKGLEAKDQGRYYYQYDSLNRLTRVMRGRDALRTYEYDAFGNRRKKVENGTTEYRYNALNQLITMRDEACDNYEYLYDSRGNLNEIYKNGKLTHHYHFGALNRLESAYNYEQDKGILYDYNGLGHRIGKRIGLPEEPVTLETNVHDIRLLTQTHIEDVIDLVKPYHNLLKQTYTDVIDAKLNQYDESYTNFVYDSGVLSAQTADETLHYFHDTLGSPMRIIDDHGHKRDVFDYDEFGNSLCKNLSEQPFGFTGYQRCEINSNLYAQAREYKPELGRFMSEGATRFSISA